MFILLNNLSKILKQKKGDIIKVYKNIFLLIFISTIVLTDYSNAQVIGKIYTKSAANNLYGSVVTSVVINTSVLQKLASQSPKYLMFQIIQGKLVVLDSKRNVIYTNGDISAVSASTVFRLFSTSIVDELLKEGNDTETYVEIRNDVLTITNGDETLEQSGACPPICP